MTDVRIKGGPRGRSGRLPGCQVDCWAAQVSTALTVSQTKYIRIHRAFCPGIIPRKNIEFNRDDYGAKCLWIILFLFQCLERVNDIGFGFGAEGFYIGLLPPKCHNVVSIDYFHSNMGPCHHVWQSNSTKSTFIRNLIELIKTRFYLCQICCRQKWKAPTFVLLLIEH